MKKNVFYYLFAALFAVTTFASCSDDEDGATPLPIDEEIAGNYGGKLDISILGQPVSGEGVPQNVTVTKAGDAAISLSIVDFSFMGIEVGDINLDNCPLLTTGDKSYSFSHDSFSLTSEDGTLTCTVAVNSGIIVNGTMTLDLSITAELGGMKQDVEVTFTGVRGQSAETESSEVAITSFTFDASNEANAAVISEPVIDEEAKTITFRVSEGGDVTKLVPTITVSEGATVSPKSGVAQDFSSPVTYTVTAADGETTVAYTVSISSAVLKFTFDEGWTEVNGDMGKSPNPNPTNLLATSNGGAALIATSLGGYPVQEETDGYVGKAVKLITYDSRKTMAGMFMGIGVTSGSLFTGQFKAEGEQTIEYTKFGIAYDRKPLRFKGAYKYAPGSPFIEKGVGTAMNYEFSTTDEIDECSIQAVLYEITSDDETLDGTNINTSDKRVAIAQLADGSAKADWTEFDIEFTWMDGKTYDAEKKYKLAIVCSSSKNGDQFRGGANSTLWVDELEVIGE